MLTLDFYILYGFKKSPLTKTQQRISCKVNPESSICGADDQAESPLADNRPASHHKLCQPLQLRHPPGPDPIPGCSVHCANTFLINTMWIHASLEKRQAQGKHLWYEGKQKARILVLEKKKRQATLQWEVTASCWKPSNKQTTSCWKDRKQQQLRAGKPAKMQSTPRRNAKKTTAWQNTISNTQLHAETRKCPIYGSAHWAYAQ